MKNKIKNLFSIASIVLYIWSYITVIAFCAKAIVNFTIASNEYNKED